MRELDQSFPLAERTVMVARPLFFFPQPVMNVSVLINALLKRTSQGTAVVVSMHMLAQCGLSRSILRILASVRRSGLVVTHRTTHS